MNKICTTIEQSQKLIELGIDVETADMHYHTNSMYEEYPCNEIVYIACLSKPEKYNKYDIPAWSLAALLDILPNDEVTTTTVTRGGWVWTSESAKYLDIWLADYETEKHDNDFTLSEDTPLDAAFEMVVWLKENNKIR